ncbi:unnamed protein product [Pocillopora meandrina]|uniref:G-protein coupled receptors family 1 profile domain-containing protein n=1 Tax=Pocillopora meandrina TaxID=46732 RepID=A0AAU9WST6_9CNID|nr:unnamed protein product [Pocillopora meandrina]
MRNQLHLLLVNLAITDVGMSASCMPFAVVTVLFHGQISTINKSFCYFNGFINTLFAMASVLTICSLCVFQYVSVVLPMNKSLTNLRCLVMVLRAWIISIFLATGPAIRNGGAINSIQTFSTTYIITLQTEQIFPTTLP